MRLIHNSRLPQFRTPFGAVTTGTSVSLSVILEDADPNQATLTLRTWVDEIGESLYPMTHEGDGIFTVELECTEPCLIWYSFICNIEGQPEVRLGAPQGRTGGEGVTYNYAEVPSFQITVYKHRENRPTWYERGMVYQIFPDRYARDENWRERTLAEVEKPRKGIQRRMVEDWNEPPEYERAEDGSIKTWDFYGGSLKGIQNDLPRIAELGFTAIYLNPIFEAASNHRYDTADYTKIDPILGTEQDFTELCEAAEKLGISIILDGVFNHTGDDSIYFNRYGNYPGVGAWQSEDSPWRDAFYFHEDGSYDCWWGVGNMPAINESSELVRERLLGKDGVIRKWLRAGAHGWRLDVANEINHEFWRAFRHAVRAVKEDIFLIGEIWEEAGIWLQGDQFDSTMNYTFSYLCRDFFGKGELSVSEFDAQMQRMIYRYPWQVSLAQMNFLDSHDIPRFLSYCNGNRKRMELAFFYLFMGVGVPSVFYGDELYIDGMKELEYRAAMDWQAVMEQQAENNRLQGNLAEKFSCWIALRKEHVALRKGNYRTIYCNDMMGVYVFLRSFGDDKVLVFLNTGTGSVTLTSVEVPQLQEKKIILSSCEGKLLVVL